MEEVETSLAQVYIFRGCGALAEKAELHNCFSKIFTLFLAEIACEYSHSSKLKFLGIECLLLKKSHFNYI